MNTRCLRGLLLSVLVLSATSMNGCSTLGCGEVVVIKKKIPADTLTRGSDRFDPMLVRDAISEVIPGLNTAYDGYIAIISAGSISDADKAKMEDQAKQMIDKFFKSGKGNFMCDSCPDGVHFQAAMHKPELKLLDVQKSSRTTILITFEITNGEVSCSPCPSCVQQAGKDQSVGAQSSTQGAGECSDRVWDYDEFVEFQHELERAAGDAAVQQ